jgi:Kef-type K+ transport system membrane component KefB
MWTDPHSRMATESTRSRKDSVSPSQSLSWPALGAYATMLAAAGAIFLAIVRYGATLSAPPAPPAQVAIGPEAVPVGTNPALHVLLALGAVIALGQLLGVVLRRLRQPPVIGEVLAGIMLGPSLLGRFAPDLGAYILPPSITPALSLIAQAGVVLYMFVVGLELNLDRVSSRAHTTVAISHASIVVPFLLGSGLALYLYPLLSTSDVHFTSFALFCGIAMSITAFPVLARILADRHMTSSELGVVALTCAAVDDVTAWCLLACVVGLVQAAPERAVVVVLLTLAFIAAMLIVVKPIVRRFVATAGARIGPAAVVTLIGALASAYLTEWIGVHAIFGAFLFGALLPHDSAIARNWVDALKTPVTMFLLPAFFAFAGMRTRIDLVSTASAWLVCAIIVVVATAGKFGGTYVAARLSGVRARQAAGLGILMNTRGLMQLIVLNIGLDLGVLSPTLFTMMVLMALVTTMATSPVLEAIVPSRA